MIEDRSDFSSLTTMDRRRFFFSLAAVGVSVGLPLPTGLSRGQVISVVEDFSHYVSWLDGGCSVSAAFDPSLWTEGKGLLVCSEEYIRENNITDWTTTELSVDMDAKTATITKSKLV